MGKFIVVVLDGFGVGYMEDAAVVRPADVGANTFMHIIEKVPDLKLPTLEKLGLMNIAGFESAHMKYSPGATTAKAALTHMGADTFWGHQEIMGTKPEKPFEEPFGVRLDETRRALEQAGYEVAVYQGPHDRMLVVNNAVTVADNIECDPGQAVNVTAAIDDIPFEQVQDIGRIVRRHVNVSRVIAFGGSDVHIEDILDAVEQHDGGYIGVNAPGSGVYNKNYHCVHMGYGVDPATQVPGIFKKAGIPVYLLGKVADIVENPYDGQSYSIVPTTEVLDKTVEIAQNEKTAFICANVQETDLSGHRENIDAYVRVLKQADEGIAALMQVMEADDILIVMADHGNDPAIGHPYHTREYVPLMLYGKKLRSGDIGVRETLSDVAATAADYFNCAPPENGTSFLDKIL